MSIMIDMKYLISFIAIVLFLSVSTPVLAKKQFPTPTPTPVPTVKSVCVDAGHGGSEIGTSNQDLLEKNVNLEVAQILKSKLITAGYTVYMTREDDIEMSNADRYNYCNSKKATILVSIHHNGSTNPDTDYSLGLYMKKSDVALAREVVNAISSTLNLSNNGISRFASGVLLKSDMPATISEGFFLTNNTEYNLIKNADRLDQEANALLVAINKYLN